MTRAYGAGTIKRERRTKAAITALDKQLVDLLKAEQPLSCRHVFYRMTDPRLPEPVEKSERGYRHVLHRLKQLRRDGVVPYSWITDSTRRGWFTPTYANAAEFVRTMAGHYRADLWRQSRWHCEVWVDSRSIAGMIQDDCRDLAVSLYPCGGFSSISMVAEAATYINAEAADGKRVCILYIGDYDPAGVLIDLSVERELRLHLGAHVDLYFHRLGITIEQIAENGLPTKPRKVGDVRSKHILETVEAEAMPAPALRRLLRDLVEQLLQQDALRVARVAEESEQQHLLQLAHLIGAA
jgi:hypothetical protein